MERWMDDRVNEYILKKKNWKKKSLMQKKTTSQ